MSGGVSLNVDAHIWPLSATNSREHISISEPEACRPSGIRCRLMEDSLIEAHTYPRDHYTADEYHRRKGKRPFGGD